MTETFEIAWELMKSDEKGDNVPTNPSLWAQAKSKAKTKFKVYPSAYANGWASKWYKSKGGGWKKKGKKVKKSWDLVKDIATATRSAELWAQNDAGIYFTVIEAIKSAVQSGAEREDVHTMLATQILPSAMINNPGFQQELVEYGEIDAMSDVDWAEVADGFIDYYDQYKEEMV